MSQYRRALPQLADRPFITDGGLETTDTFGRANTANIGVQAEAARADQSTTDGERMSDAVDKYKHGAPVVTNAPAASRVGEGGN